MPSKFASNPTIAALVQSTRAAETEYKQTQEKIDELLNPHDAVKRLHQLIGESHDPAFIKAAQTQIAALSGPGAEDAKNRGRSIAFRAFEPVKAAANALLLKASEIAIESLNAAIEAEAEFFARHGLPYEKTSLSRNAENVLVEVARRRSAVNAVGQGYSIPRLSSGFLEFFTA